MTRRSELFATKTSKDFQHIGTKFYVELHGSNDPTVQVAVEECPTGKYWAWWDMERQVFMWMWRAKFMVEMCFPDSGESAIKNGEGEIVQVSAVER